MADAKTLRRLSLLSKLKRWTPPFLAALIGILAKIFFDYSPLPAVLNLTQNIWLLAIDPDGLTTWLDSRPLARWLLTWVAAPAALFGAILLLTGLRPVRKLIDRLFPDPPAFVSTDLDAARGRDMLLINPSVSLFSGRLAELAELGKLLETGPTRSRFAWRQLLGPSGIGKTRLAIEWLAEAQARNWDVGIADPEDRHLLGGWRARRPTALVIDESRSLWGESLSDALLRLARGASKKSPVRVLVLDQVPSAVRQGNAADQALLERGEIAPPLLVDRLGEKDMAALIARPSMSGKEAERIVAESAGRPRAALIIANIPDADSYGEALKRWAEMLVPQLARDDETPPASLTVPLIFSALVGPLPTDFVRPLLEGFDPGPLLRFFPGESRKSLEARLPALVPDDLAQELALRLLWTLDRPIRERIIATLLADAPDRMEASLGNIWSDRPDLHTGDGDSPRAAGMLRFLQDGFDRAFPKRIAAIRSEAARLVGITGNPQLGISALEDALARIQRIVGARPFDPTVRLHLAGCAVNAVLGYGRAGKFAEMETWAQRLDALPDDRDSADNGAVRIEQIKGALNAVDRYGNAGHIAEMERWGRQLITLVDDPRFDGNPDIGLWAVKGAVNGILYNGQAKNFVGLERWGQRLIALAENPRFADNLEIRLWDARGALNAMNQYGPAGRLADMERWGRRLTALADDPRFAGNLGIRLWDAGGAVSAILYSGKAKNFAEVEKWGERLRALADDPRFSDKPGIRLEDAKGALNAIDSYGASGRIADMERWGRRLISLADDPRFADNPDIRLQDAGAAINGILYHGKAKNFVELERWGERLIALADDPRFAGNPQIRLRDGQGALNAIDCYGGAGRFADMERWGRRLVVLADDPRFVGNPNLRLQEARGAVNAIIYYGRAGMLGEPEEVFWKRRLALVAQAFVAHPGIQDQAMGFDLAFFAQQRRGWPYGQLERDGSRS